MLLTHGEAQRTHRAAMHRELNASSTREYRSWGTFRVFVPTSIRSVMVACTVAEQSRAEKTDRALRTLARAIADGLWRSEVQSGEMEPANGAGIPEGRTNPLPPASGQASGEVRDGSE